MFSEIGSQFARVATSLRSANHSVVRPLVAEIRGASDAVLRPFLVNPSSGKSLGYMDGIRAFAVLWVIIFHSWVLSGAPPLVAMLPGQSAPFDYTAVVAYGFLGVQLFFVLSGFLLSQYWLRPDYKGKPRPSLRQYVKQRLSRILPAYYVCLFFLLLFFVPNYIPVANVFSRYGFFNVVAHIFFLQYLFPVSSASFTIDGSLWTLTMEMTFYAVLPLLIWFFLRGRWPLALGVSAAISFGWYFLTKNSMWTVVQFYEHQTPYVPNLPEDAARTFLSLQFPAHLVTFALGISLANLWVRREAKMDGAISRWLLNRWTSPVYFVAGLALLFVVIFVLSRDATASYYFTAPVASLGFTLAIAGILFGGEWLRLLFSLTPLRYIGIISYSMYLWHMPLIYVFNAYPTTAALPPAERYPHVFWLTLGAVVALSTLLYLGIERPFMMLARSKKAKSGAAAPSVPSPVPVAVSPLDVSAVETVPVPVPTRMQRGR